MPVGTYFNETVACEFELVGGELSVFLKDVFFRGRAEFFANFLTGVVGKVFGLVGSLVGKVFDIVDSLVKPLHLL